MEERTDHPPATVLVVDDNDANRSLARNTLEDEGYRVVLANDGAEALRSFEKENPECVLLDVRMPVMDGFEACEKIRALPRGPETPIIFLTALRDVDTFDRALRAGGDDFLTKPVRPTELVVRVQTALKLRRMNVELRQHYDLLKQQRDDLMRVQLEKERLTAFVVHDLKNPVNSMDLHAQIVLRDKGLSDPARESAARIRLEARQLNRMILNLLDVSKGNEGKLAPKIRDISLGPLVEEIVSELDINAKFRKVTLRTSLATDGVRADEDLLRRVLANLLENAIRYAPPQSEVIVSATKRAGDTEIRVADAGSGIPANMREKVFDPFMQVDARAQGDVGRSGRGLGLTFCKLAVEAQGGRIWIEDAAPGAVFCVRFANGT